MQSNIHKPHIGKLAIMANQGATLRLHLLASEETELSLRILFFESCHQVAGMKVATGLACYEVILHFCKDSRFLK